MSDQMTPEQLATELLTTNQSMKNGAPDARRLLAELQRDWLHQAARLMENAGYDDDAVNWLDSYADYDPTGDMARPTVQKSKPDTTDYGIRLTPDAPDSEVLDYRGVPRVSAEDALQQNRVRHPNAQLLQRTVRHGAWRDAR